LPGPLKRERPSPTAVLPPSLWDAARSPLRRQLTALAPEDAVALKDALTASMLANEQVLYGPDRAPRDASGPPTDTTDLSNAPGVHDRHLPDQGPAVDPAQVRPKEYFAG
jgi:hypothetical protein